MAVKDWTPEQIRNASIYGICRVCGAPREHKETWTLGREPPLLSFSGAMRPL